MQENSKDNQLFQVLPQSNINSRVKSNKKEHTNTPYSFYEAVEAFEDSDFTKVTCYLHIFKKVSLNDYYTYILDFDESGFSDYLISFIDSSTNIDILYASLDILLNLTHYQQEFTFLFSLVERGLYPRLNNLFQTPVNENVYRKSFILLSNISLSTKENRDELFSNIDLSFLVDSRYESLYSMNDAFHFFSKVIFFPSDRDMLANIFDLIFPYLYERCKENDYFNYKLFVSFLYEAQNLFDDDFFEHYLLGNDVFPDIIAYFANFSAAKPKTKLKILSILKKFLPKNPNLFKSLTDLILEYIELEASPERTMLDDQYIQGFAYLMNQLFLENRSIFNIEELQQILFFLLYHEINLYPELKIQIGFIAFGLIPSFPPSFTHSNLELLYNSCNDWFASGITGLLINTISLVITIQKNEDLFDESFNFLSNFVEENMEVLNQIIEKNENDQNLKYLSSLMLKCFYELNNDSD